MSVLHDKYRPQTWDQVVGQGNVVNALVGIIKRKASRAFLFCGPSGCGKTTLARIAARSMGCKDTDLLEIDAATHTGIDNMRDIQDIIRYKPLSGGIGRAVILDECHALTSQSWQSLLKAVEKPPEHMVWFFCTTESDKVPETLKTRCSVFTLDEVDNKDLGELYDTICEQEDIKLPGDVGDLVIRQAYGSPRRMLVNLEKCRSSKDRKQAAAVLQTIADLDTVRDLCQFLMKPGSWQKVMGIVKDLEKENPESIRLVVCDYIGKVLKGATQENEIRHLLSVLEAFSRMYHRSEGRAQLLLSIGQVKYGV